MSLVTMIPRMLPVWVLGKKNYPEKMVIWLRYIPVAMISALLAPEILRHEQKFDLSWSNHYFWAAIPTFIIAIKTKSLFYTLVGGMMILACIRLLTTWMT
jgi:branched-subunit amino acid transport protein